MLIRLGYEIAFRLPQPTSMLVTLNIHDSRRTDIVIGQELRALPGVPMRQYHDSFGNTCTRLHAPAGLFTLYADAVVQDDGQPDPVAPGAREVPVDQLPDDTLLFLLGSRYCETDQLVSMAWDLFGATPPGWARVQAICDYVHNAIQFGYQHARATKGAVEALQEGRGVCRDFAHSAIALCRCMNIPARYCTGYLGDIGIPPVDAPMDFSAWFEAYLDGRWYTFDARHNTPRIGRVLIARGRDAADAAISNSFGFNTLEKFEVWTDETDDPTLSPRVPVPPMPLGYALT
ncbi:MULTISPECIES: transglutaminase-like domain-containing protein [Pseudoxanthomonas]|jgi:transglutaminase-like putative cysteine protease|uniref:Transglutaminase family protein n=1 Tax=Pseudoxanthomonas winnipegensis TaxID=2480810 RepID=A0A4Q8LWG6_9GAMM|nr:transglutaminase family protein [Pseudoxanthomonas winnipegensis]MDQ1119971.1 transglutaminase-like putative cysteine protease [Pseudoxanthomonas winnipegensis]MDQ1133174.1 transglutaminase-like putative cysteine protease [Pseudoxanthomonas winnipegensis]RZZ85463.1 transglutaminase family protein [Pseudoxanthomonas winnipegensis]TAA10639.1 transglutaminase family protein [Pseudoxanthomonas winnipegensis]TAA22204.1 transglutaminase family protein [Pseudoxanthomonas winnipegensis]